MIILTTRKIHMKYFNNTLSTPLNNNLKYLKRKDYCLYCKWKKYGKLEVAYEKKDNDSLSNYISYVSVSFKNLIYGDLASLQQLLAKKYVWKMVSLVHVIPS